MQYRLEKLMKGTMASFNPRSHTGAITLIVESGVLYAASQVHEHL
jgi:hypothetical protein